MEMPRMAVRRLEAEAAFAEIHLARNARLFHPLERAVHGGAADAVIVFADEVDEIRQRSDACLAKKHADDLVALARMPCVNARGRDRARDRRRRPLPW